MRKKLTLSIDAEVIEKAKKKANIVGIPLSRLVERALKFFASPSVFCFYCGRKFELAKAKLCTNCGWFICPYCKSCGCKLGSEGKRVAHFFRKTLIEIFGTL